MTITIDRNSGLFTPELSDKINSQSNSLYENIKQIKAPAKRIRERVTGFTVTPDVDMKQYCYSIGNLHIVNLHVNGTIRSEDKAWTRLCILPIAPATDIYTLTAIEGTAAGAILKISAGDRNVYLDTFGGSRSNFDVYFTYIK